MIKVKTKRFPSRGYKCIAIWPFIFCKMEMKEKDWNHERTHGRQQAELLLIFFYLIYFVEWLFRGYDNISFEQEAYKNQGDSDYLKNRKPYNQWR